MNEVVLNKIKTWKEFDALDQDLKQELESIENNEDALLDAFGSDIAFGTGGLRGILGWKNATFWIYFQKCGSICKKGSIRVKFG